MATAPKLGTVPSPPRLEPKAAFEGLIRSREAAKLLCVSEWLLRQLAHEGELSYIQRTPRSPMLFDIADLRTWVEKEKIRRA